jgi:hypothetical protein
MVPSVFIKLLWVSQISPKLLLLFSSVKKSYCFIATERGEKMAEEMARLVHLLVTQMRRHRDVQMRLERQERLQAEERRASEE